MKKLLSLFLVLTFMLVPISVNASENNFHSNGTYQITGHVMGTCEMGDFSESEYNTHYDMVVDINSTIVFETLLDTLYISEDEKGGETYFEFRDGEKKSGEICSVKYESGFRNDTDDYSSFDVDIENEVEYIKENATVRFNKAGHYLLTATLGAAEADERLSQLIEIGDIKESYYFQPEVLLSIVVSEETASETIYDSFYDEKIFSVVGITNFDNSREVMNDYSVAICSAPVVIKAEANLANIVVARLENIGGEWKETRFFDGLGINLGDSTKNWYPAPGFEDTYEDCFEYTGSEDFVEGFVPVKKGTSISLAEPGMYSLWAETESGEYTGLTFEIGDTIATYTNSKVLVDGKEIKFEAYNINGNNYFKLRDIAYAITNHGSGAATFNVLWDGERNMINLVSQTAYEAAGGELEEGDGKNKKYQVSSSALLKDGANVTLNAYLINDNNYFKLRDLGKLFDFNVDWDGANNCILIDTTASYIE